MEQGDRQEVGSAYTTVQCAKDAHLVLQAWEPRWVCEPGSGKMRATLKKENLGGTGSMNQKRGW